VSTALDHVLEHLDGLKRSGAGYIARCPAHEDHRQSLSLAEGDDGRVLLTCHAGCDLPTICAALEMTPADLFEKNGDGSRAREIVAEYDYSDEAGEPLFQVVRFAPKDFRQRRQVVGEWVWKLGETRRVLYRLPQVIATAKAGGTVYVAEGEKDVHAIEHAGAVATCNAGGAGKWRNEYNAALTGAHVVIVADKDEPGRAHAASVAAAVKPYAASVRVCEAKVGKDASDHLGAGYGLEDFVGVDANPVRSAFVTAPELAALEDEAFDWVLDGYVAPYSTTQLSGAPKLAGKTTWALCLSAAVARGAKFMGRATRKGVFVYLTEQTRKTFKVSARGTGVLENPDIHVLLRSRVWAQDWETIIREATAYCLEVGAVLLIVDTLGRWASLMGDAENDAGAALQVMQPLEEAAAAGLAVLVVRHDRKDPGANIVDAGRGSGAYAGAFDQLLALKRVGGAGHDNRRKLCCEGRFEETPRELVIEYEGGVYLDRGTEANVESAEVRSTVLAVLRDADEARTFDHLLEACGGPARETTLQRVLGTEGKPDKGKTPSGLVGDGLVCRAKGAGAASPKAYGYWLPTNHEDTRPIQLPIPVGRGELTSPPSATVEAGLLPSARPKAQTGELSQTVLPTPHGLSPIGGEK